MELLLGLLSLLPIPDLPANSLSKRGTHQTTEEWENYLYFNYCLRRPLPSCILIAPTESIR